MPSKPQIVPTDPYALYDNIYVTYELEFGKDVIRPGCRIKFKNDRSIYQFKLLAHNVEKDVTWIDCISVDGRQWHSFYVETLKGVVKPKRSRRHKPNHE